MLNPDHYDIYNTLTFETAFQNPNGQNDWINDREDLIKRLQTQIPALDNNPTSYRALARNLIRCAHDLDTAIKGGGLFEQGMSDIKIPDCFVTRCDAIKEELLHQGKLLIDSPAPVDSVAVAVELIAIQIGRLTLSRDGDADAQAEGWDLLVEQLRLEVLGNDGEEVKGSEGDLWECLDFPVPGCECVQCTRRLLID